MNEDDILRTASDLLFRSASVPASVPSYGADWDEATDPQAIEAKVRMLASDQMPGGRADGMEPEDFDSDQLEKGVMHEMEHTKDPLLAREIAMDHLAENPRYYDDLEKIEPTADKIIRKDPPRGKPQPGQPSPPPPGPTENPRYELQNKPKAASSPTSSPWFADVEQAFKVGDRVIAEPVPGARFEGTVTYAGTDGAVEVMEDSGSGGMYEQRMITLAKPKPIRDEGEKPPVEDRCDDCGADVGACGCKNLPVRADVEIDAEAEHDPLDREWN